MSILPPLPTPPDSTVLKMKALSARETTSFARTVTVPAFPCPEVEAVSTARERNEKEPECFKRKSFMQNLLILYKSLYLAASCCQHSITLRCCQRQPRQ